MPRYRLDIEYDGTPYAGWQRQAGQHSVQAAIEQAIKSFCGETISLRGAGRTDAGVHATGQVAHVDLTKDWPADTVRDARQRASAGGRETRRDPRRELGRRTTSMRASRRPAATISTASSTGARRRRWRRNRAWWVPKPLDAEAMHEAAQRLLGRHDFTTFRSTQCQAEQPGADARPARRVSGCGDVIEVGPRRARSCTIRCARWSAR